MADISKIILPNGDLYNIKDNNSIHFNQINGFDASFNTTIQKPLSSLIVNIDPLQSGSGDPSSENIRPITGWTQVKITRTGKNLCGGLKFATAFSDAKDYSLDENTKTFSFSRNASNIIGIRDFGIKYKENTQYTLTGPYIGSSNYAFRVYYTDGTYDTIRFYDHGADDITVRGFNTQNNKTVDYFALVYVSNSSAGLVTMYYDEWGIFENVYNAADYALFYEPYIGDVYNISLPAGAGTVYGGTLDIVNGILTVNKGYINSYNGESLSGEWISDRDTYNANATPTTGAQVVYQLATPLVYSLSPIQINTVVGDNNIWADCGNISLSYSNQIGYDYFKCMLSLFYNESQNGNGTAVTIGGI